MKFKLRDYQEESVESVFGAWARGVQRPAIVLATGLGKTVIFSEVCSRLVREEKAYPCILVHRDELVNQAVDKLRATDPGLSIGVVKAERNEIDRDIVVASVQTLIRRLAGKKAVPRKRFTHIIVDECHHAAAKSYVAILKHFGAIDGDGFALGVTATLARSDGVPLGHIWEEVVHEMGTAEGIDQGYLVRPIAKRAVIKELDLSKIRTLGGDWRVEELGGAMVRAGEQIAKSLLDHAMGPDGLRRTIVFAPTVQTAGLWADDFAFAGIRTRVVTGTTPLETRAQAYKALDAQEIDAIVSCMVLTEGFDLPSVEVAVIGRPTKSLPLYTQMVGRVLRPSPETGKETALVLDVCGVMTDKLVTLVDLALPPVCECACRCEVQHLCPMECNCPRDIKGRLKRPCIICHKVWQYQTKEQRQPCDHYGKNKHVAGCRHTCDGLGRPGVHPEDDPVMILDPEVDPKELVIDGTDLELAEAELFSRVGKRAKVVAEKRRKPKAWRTTASGRPYLPSTSTYEYIIFLHQEENSSWSVGEKPRKGGPATRLAYGLTLARAIEIAEDNHPSGGKPSKPLVGLPSESQLKTMRNVGIEIPKNCTKQQASDLLSDFFATRSVG